MKDLKHTKGEWNFNFSSIGPQKVTYQTDTVTGLLATVNTTGDISIEEIKANAKLIAAAPDLLDACNLEELYSLVVGLKMPHETLDVIIAKVKECREAIKKATE